MKNKGNNKMPYILLIGLSLCFIYVMHSLSGIFLTKGYALEFSDLNSCYIEQIYELKRIFLSGNFKELLHSWNRMDGSTPLAMANIGILLNPLALIFFITPVGYISIATKVYITLKYILAGMAFLYMLRYVHPSPIQEKQNELVQVTLSLAWGFNVYFVMHHFLIIWTDFMILLPLTICVIHRFLYKTTGIKLLTITLLWSFLANFYYAYILVCFSFLYLISEIIKQRFPVKASCKALLKYIVAHFIALILALPILYPSFKLLLKTGTYQSSVKLGIAKPAPLLFAKLTTALYNDALLKESIYIFIGITAIFLLLLIVTTQTIDFRSKCIDMSLVIFMILSFLFNPLYIAWHAFDEPNGFPGRMGYCLIFIVLLTVYRYYNVISCTPRQVKLIKISSIALIPIVVISYMQYSNELYFLGTSMAVLIFFIICFNEKYIRILPYILTIETLLTSILLFNIRYRDCGLPVQNVITQHRVSLEQGIEDLKLLDNPKDSFYRITLKDVPVMDINSGPMFNIKTVNAFNNVNNRLFTETTNLLHSGQIVGNSILLNDTTPFTNFMLGIKYQIAPQESTIVRLQDQAYLGFAVKEPITVTDLKRNIGGCYNQNTIIQKMTGLNLPIFKEIHLTKEGKQTYTYLTEKDTSYYIFTRLKENDWSTRRIINEKGYDYTTPGLVYNEGTGSSITCSIESETDLIEYKDSPFMVMQFLEDNYKQHEKILKQQVLRVDSFDDFNINASINIKEDNILIYIALPNANYKIYEGDQMLPIEEPLPGYLGVRLNKGMHNLTIRYSYF